MVVMCEEIELLKDHAVRSRSAVMLALRAAEAWRSR
jgi:hypothetical protein